MFLIAAIVAPLCRADDSLALADKLLDLSGAASLTQQGFETGIKPSLDRMRAQGAPAELVDSIHVEAQRFFDENFKWDDVKPQIAKLYTDTFTEAELRDLIAFYQTPTGLKAIAKMPVLMQQGAALGMSRVQAKMPEFQQRIATLIADYRKKADAAAAAAQPAPAAQPASVAPATPAAAAVPAVPAK